MEKVDKIRNRMSYKRFLAIQQTIVAPISIDEKMKYIYLQMNDMSAFHSQKNADYALESLRQLLQDIK